MKTETEAPVEQSPIRPLTNRVVVKVVQREEKTPGGIYLPQNAENKDPQVEGVLLELGAGAFVDGTAFVVAEGGDTGYARAKAAPEPGDVVMFSKYAGVKVEKDGAEFRVLDDKELLGVIR